jgi:uncharacterized protein YjiS (DUF1127 family)
MTMISVLLSQIALGTGRYLATVAGALLSAAGKLLKEWQYRTDIHKLQSLSDRQLSDIGLSRGRIEDAVRGGAPREPVRTGGLSSQFR